MSQPLLGDKAPSRGARQPHQDMQHHDPRQGSPKQMQKTHYCNETSENLLPIDEALDPLLH